HDDQQVRRLFDRVRDECGGLDILINNVFNPDVVLNGFGTPFWELPIQTWDEAMAIGLRSHFVASVLAIPLMIGRGGLIVNISAAGAKFYGYSVPFGVQKAGLDRLTADMAHELKNHDVTVVSVWPGAIRTELYDH